MSSNIDISGADLVVLAKRAYALSKPHGMGFFHAQLFGSFRKEPL